MARFNIEKYLNSLPDDIKIIDVNYKNITYIPSLERFYKLEKFNRDYNRLTELPNLPNTLK